jgi:major type 1 subunit fimbrin (pilin)
MKILSLASLFFLAVLLPSTSVATSTTTISVTGQIVPETCDIDIGSQNQSIDLGEYFVTAFPSAGSVTQSVPFSLNIKNCSTGITAAKIKFSGRVIQNSSLFLLEGGGYDIGLQLLNAQNEAVVPGNVNTLRLKGGDNTLSFYMHLMSSQSSVTAGYLNATIKMDIEYE